MPVASAVPVRASVRDLLSDLLGCSTRVVDGAAQKLSTERPAMLAVYRRDDGTPAAVCVSDQDFAIRAGAAIAMMPLEEAMPPGAPRELDGDLLEFFREVVNVLAKLLNSPATPHVALREVQPVPGEVLRDVAELIASPAQRCDYRVTLEGYGDGVITLLAG
jgi:hypothetical protein